MKETVNNFNFTKEDYYKMHNYNNTKNKIVIYSAVVGNYDTIIDSKIKKETNVDYIMFSDKKINSKFWQSRDIPIKIKKINDSTLINRYLKFHPNELFDNKYDYSIYIDGNVLINDKLIDMISLLDKENGIAMHKHYSRNCIYDESLVCMLYGKGNKNEIKRYINFLKKQKFPKKYGLLEAPVIITDLNNKKAIKILEKIYNLLLESKTNRDQLCIPYVLWQNNIQISQIGTLGCNIHFNKKIEQLKHNKR